MSENDDRRTWTQQRRFEFLEWKMFWENRVIRSDLESTFGISTPQASVDLRNYRETAPGNLEPTARGYKPSPKFKPRFLIPSADRLLLQLRAALSGVIPKSDLWFREVPPVEVAPDIARSVSPECLRQLLMAMRERVALEIRYHALTGARRRAIAPHALAFDGHRWHVRAWCCDKEDFRDFVLSRIDEIGDMKPIQFDPEHDIEWATKIMLRLRPHRGLSPEQIKVIELDYGMVDGRLDLEMRASLAFYFIRRINLDVAESKQLSPERLQIELENFETVMAQIQEAKERTRELVRKER
ncbi:helix-turn-helix transcriptional regulator [Sinorhizobium meliloti]|uniref:helix-turn-helix transcriptional regulator n=1 Tax=Rhizobium meliloti TaxID=382 RepID=UPI000B49EC67|nr:WYL domain-containing protein [Sinorhizobium meliloti]ASQ15027.1 WYL domain-containing protein [Sinorhizobium meliloti]MQU84975.1 WYL domain-containing protein [Sinorhizobium meliloti]MQU88416.1 WYL domain-containing protein [Sinorhizobium meliloti]MQV05911.1 WYL domain-containing protein [Sinorhizobium meliloti]